MRARGLTNFYVPAAFVAFMHLVSIGCGKRAQESHAPDSPEWKIANSKDVAWLERIAGSWLATQELHPAENLWQNGKDLCTRAYARLGAIGTVESLAAAERIESAARSRTLTPDKVPLGRWPHASWTFSDPEVTPLATAKTLDGTTYGVVMSHLLGDMDWFLISSTTPEDKESWSRPKLIPCVVNESTRDLSLSAMSNDVLILTFVQDKPEPRGMLERTPQAGWVLPSRGPQKIEIRIQDVLRDTTGCGWTDVEKQRFGLDPNKKDISGSGCCLNYAPPKSDADDEDVQVIQKAIFAAFGLTKSRYLLLVEPGSRKVQVWGYLRPVLYLEHPEQWRRMHDAGILVKWEIIKRTGRTATVGIRDWEGEMASGTQIVYLKKIGQKWFVVAREFGRVS